MPARHGWVEQGNVARERTTDRQRRAALQLEYLIAV
jgi:hypothetical protein